MINLDIKNIYPFASEAEINAMQDQVTEKFNVLKKGTGKGNDFLGWIDLPSAISDNDLQEIEEAAEKLKKKSEIIVVIGIGGSYLGAKAVNDALSNSLEMLMSKKENPVMIFAGHNIGEDYMHELLQTLEGNDYSIVVISKSGTTTEPAIAFRILKDHLTKKYDRKEATSRIIAITDEKKGALRTLANEEGYETFVIPDDIGGRYSVLTPVGLVPLAACGFNIRELVKGALDMQKKGLESAELEKNPAARYAAARNVLYQKGKKIEILVNYHNKLHYVAEWWKQLYGESEGKDGKGIYPAAVDNSSDLHSMGQYIQEGERLLFETVLSIKKSDHDVEIPKDDKNLDGLNYLAGKKIDVVNKMAELGTTLAHIDGGVPNMRIEIPVLNAYYIGQLMYFFELACGISGYLLEVNPFNQPGVEAYKKNMFALLEKPGFEEETKKIKKRI
ncbi:MAG TPA: glucose-6-phosphate isomerase [Bacteroidales bacterium]|nr:glucose-6-phosphate isomerase [Bacteroidales bacterium]